MNQDTYYHTMNVLLTPIRFAIECFKALLILIAGVLIAVCWPLILYIKGEPVNLASFVITGLTLLAIFTFFYNPSYFVLGGIVAVGLCWVYLMFEEIPSSVSIPKLQFAFFIFLLLGNLLKFAGRTLIRPSR